MISRVSIICGIEILERFAYYGLRSILFLFLINAMDWDRNDTVGFYGTFTAIVIIGPLFAGLLADLTKLPGLFAIIGSALSAVGALGLAITSDPFMVKTMLVTVALGSALYKPNIISLLYRATWPQKQHFDLVYSIFYFSVNIGGFLAPLIIGVFSDTGNPEHFRIGFLVCGGVSLVVTTLLGVFYNTLKSNDILYNSQTFTLTENSAATIVVLFVTSLIFWSGYELFNYVGAGEQSMTSQLWVAGTSVVISLLIIPLSLINGFRGAYKIAIGLGLSSVAYLLLVASGLMGKTPLLVLSIAEMLVAPILFSRVIQIGSPRFTATLTGGLILMTYVTNKLVSGILSVGENSYEKVMILWAIISVSVAVGIFLLDYLRPQNPSRA